MINYSITLSAVFCAGPLILNLTIFISLWILKLIPWKQNYHLDRFSIIILEYTIFSILLYKNRHFKYFINVSILRTVFSSSWRYRIIVNKREIAIPGNWIIQKFYWMHFRLHKGLFMAQLFHGLDFFVALGLIIKRIIMLDGLLKSPFSSLWCLKSLLAPFLINFPCSTEWL